MLIERERCWPESQKRTHCRSMRDRLNSMDACIMQAVMSHTEELCRVVATSSNSLQPIARRPLAYI